MTAPTPTPTTPPARPELSKTAVVALVLAVIPFFFFNLFAIMLGVRALLDMSTGERRLRGKPIAILAIVIGAAMCVAWAVVRFVLKR